MSKTSDTPGRAEKGRRKIGRCVAEGIEYRGERRYMIRIYVGYKANGKPKIFNKAFRGELKAAKAWRAKAMQRKDQGLPLEENDLTFSDFLSEWLEIKAETVRPRSLEIYTANVERHIRPALGGRKLAKIDAAMIQAFYKSLTGEKGLSGATVAMVHNALTNVFKLAMRRDLITRNPMAAVEPPRIERREMKALTLDEIKLVLKAADDAGEGYIIGFLLMTGCRPGEAQALKWSDFDMERGTVTIQRNLVRLKSGSWQFGEPKTTTGRRTIPIGRSLIDRILAHRANQDEARARAGRFWQDYGLVFCDEIGQPCAHDRLTRIWKATLKAAGLPTTFRTYDTRHSHASFLMAEGFSPKLAAERLGHADVSITLRVYSHLQPGAQEAATERLEKAISG